MAAEFALQFPGTGKGSVPKILYTDLTTSVAPTRLQLRHHPEKIAVELMKRNCKMIRLEDDFRENKMPQFMSLFQFIK